MPEGQLDGETSELHIYEYISTFPQVERPSASQFMRCYITFPPATNQLR